MRVKQCLLGRSDNISERFKVKVLTVLNYESSRSTDTLATA